MEKINQKYDKKLAFIVYGALMVLAVGLLTSTSLLALSHVLIVLPALYFLPRTNYRAFSKSSWALLALTLVVILSVVANQSVAINGYRPMFKAKYFLFGFVSIVPFSWYFKNYYTEKKVSILLYAFCISTTVASIAGMIGLWTGINPILQSVAHPTRNSGLFGMLMNYAHNLSFFLVIIVGLLLFHKKSKQFISTKFLCFVFVINFIGFYLTYTRGAWLGFLMAIPFFFVRNHFKSFIGILLVLLSLGLGAYYFAGVKVIRPESDIQRFSQWQAALIAFKERPVLGYGYLNFEQHSAIIKIKYDLPAKEFRGHAHNNFMEVLGSMGTIGAIAFLAWLITWVIDVYKRKDLLGLIGLPFIIAFIGGGLTQSTISLGINLFFIMAVFALTQIDPKLVKEN